MTSYRLVHRHRALLMTLATALAWVVFAVPAQGARDCDLTGGEVVARSPGGKVAVMRDANRFGHELYMACWRPTGKLRTMTADWLPGGRPVTRIGGFAFRGSWVAWAQTSIDGTETDSMSSMDARTGRRGPSVTAHPDARAAKDHGPVRHPGAAAPRLVAVSRSGLYAWLVRGVRTPEGKKVDALYVPRDGFAHRLDVGPVGSIQRLFFRGEYLVWLHDGRLRAVRPDPTGAETRPTPARDEPDDSCDPTSANGSTPPGELPSPSWHGNGRLWTNIVGRHGELRFPTRFSSPDDPAPVGRPGIHADGSATAKVVWIGPRAPGPRWRTKRLRITGRLLDGAAPRIHDRSRSTARNGNPHLWAMYLTFPTPGCWRVTATAGDARLSVRIRVVIPQGGG